LNYIENNQKIILFMHDFCIIRKIKLISIDIIKSKVEL
jgi:hypothetical protein